MEESTKVCVQGCNRRVVESTVSTGVRDGRNWTCVARRAERGEAVIFAMGFGLGASKASLHLQRSEERTLW